MRVRPGRGAGKVQIRGFSCPPAEPLSRRRPKGKREVLKIVRYPASLRQVPALTRLAATRHPCNTPGKPEFFPHLTVLFPPSAPLFSGCAAPSPASGALFSDIFRLFSNLAQVIAAFAAREPARALQIPACAPEFSRPESVQIGSGAVKIARALVKFLPRLAKIRPGFAELRPNLVPIPARRLPLPARTAKTPAHEKSRRWGPSPQLKPTASTRFIYARAKAARPLRRLNAGTPRKRPPRPPPAQTLHSRRVRSVVAVKSRPANLRHASSLHPDSGNTVPS